MSQRKDGTDSGKIGERFDSAVLEDTLAEIEPASLQMREEATGYIRTLTMPDWALGRLLDLAVDLAGMTRSLRFPVANKEVLLLAGDHGIVAEGVCPQSSEITAQMVRNFVSGGAGINALAAVAHAKVTVVDMGVAADLHDLAFPGKIVDCKIAPGTKNFAKGPAMSRAEAIRALEIGIALVEQRAATTDVFGTGEMGIGNTSPSSAIVTVLSGASDPSAYVGRGAGLPTERLKHKAEVIRKAIELNHPDRTDALDVLAKIGGFEIGGIAGVILGAARHHKPVVVDGFISSAGALIAGALSPASRDYMILAHGSAEPGHAMMAQLLNKQPLLNLGMCLGEGTGAALAMPLLDAAASVMTGMATFTSAKVSDKGIRR
ncbi:MAG: nicotinate-nucleotide--dimethylbenzimidazole phosphoribosyltransferase [Victivallaceae bacterium]|nr:nicotinate-nucleotide--dimethylbenzimidazole phosphoribosyltransferase [Victivallaceae bacterium]